MGKKQRRVLVGVTLFFWVDWLVCVWAGMHYHVGNGHVVATEALRMLVAVMSVASLLVYLVGPMLATAKVWLTIGRRDHERTCECSKWDGRAVGDVVPIRPVRHLHTTDN